MKRKPLLIATIVFFLIVNTTYYWEGKMGMFAMVTFLILILFFIVLAVLLLFQICCAVNEKYNDRHRLLLIMLMTVVIALTYFFPLGLISLYKSYGDIFIAQREGAANCMTTLILRDDKTFIERKVCFGVTEITGTYSIKGDTIYFDNVSPGRQVVSDFYSYGVIKNQEIVNEKYSGFFVVYKNFSDITGKEL